MEFALESLRAMIANGGPTNSDERHWLAAWCSNLQDQKQHEELLGQLQGLEPHK